jgi:CRISPR/Cas system-associated exonuclease Cas4 (RecB family)
VRKDIHIPKVEGVSMAVVKETDNADAEWGVYLINRKTVELKNIIVASKGYGIINDEEIKTSTLRHFHDELEANSFQKIEKIMPDVFGLNNEYMLTFYIDGVIHDRKYIFVPDSVLEYNLIQIPLVERPGILIR